MAAAALAVIAAACGGGAPTTDSTPAPTATLPVPMASLSPRVQVASAAVADVLAGGGFELEHVVQPFRTGEPAALRLVPRALFRVRLADPESGWVVVYDAGSRDRATQLAGELVGYLQSGFGQTNFPMDAQFAVNQLDAMVTFSWFSRERSGDPEAAEQAFELLRRVGQPHPVRR